MPTKQELLAELTDLRARLEEAEETLRAIRQGEVDALVVSSPEGEQVYTLKGADHSYRVLVESISEGTATLAPGGDILYANNRLAQIMGFPLERVIGSTMGDYIIEADLPRFAALTQSARKENSAAGEFPLQAGDGTQVPVYLSLSNLSIEENPGAFCLVVTDLTQQKRDAALLAEGRLSQAILAQAEQAIAVCDESGRIIKASHGLHQLCDFNPLFEPFEKVFPLCLNSSKPVSLEPLFQGESIHNAEMHFFRKDGKQVFLLVNSGPLLDEQQRPMGFVVAFTDITERKQAEAALREINERLKKVLEVETVGVMFWDLNTGCMTDANDSFLNLMGYSRREVEACELTWQKLTPPEYLEVSLAEISKFQATGRVGPYEKEYFHKDGTRQWFVSAGSSLGNNTCVEFCVDISGRKQAEAERQKLIKELQVTQEEIQAANEELMAQTEELQVQGEELQQSHDLLEQRVAERTAEVVAAKERMRYLTVQALSAQEQERKRISMDLHDDLGQSLLVLRMQLNAMLRENPSEPAIRQGLGESAGFLLEIINKTRDLSHALSPAPLGKQSLTEAINGLLQDFHKHSNIGTEADVDEVGPALSKEARIGIYRILQEFLVNVHKHAQATKVKLGIKAIEDLVAVTMEDNGIGFDLDEVRSTIHKPGGLGLLSMEGRVQMLGGQLSLDSQKGQGTRLHFKIPQDS